MFHTFQSSLRKTTWEEGPPLPPFLCNPPFAAAPWQSKSRPSDCASTAGRGACQWASNSQAWYLRSRALVSRRSQGIRGAKKDTVLLKPGPPPWGVSFLAPWRLRGISIHYPPQREARAVYSASEPGSRSLSPVPNVPSSGTQRPVSSGNSWAPLVRTNSLQVHRSQLTTATGSYMRTYRATRLLD